MKKVKVTVKDIFPQIVENRGGAIILRYNEKKKKGLTTMSARCIKALELEQQLYLLVRPTEKIGLGNQKFSVGQGTEVLEYGNVVKNGDLIRRR